MEVSAVHRVLQVADINDVSCWQAFGHWTDISIALIELVIQEKVLLPILVVDRALVSVLGTWVAETGDDVGCVAALVSGIVDGQSVLVRCIANITTEVLLIWTAIHETFSIMDVTISGRTARAERIRWIRDVQVDHTSTAWKLASYSDGLIATDGAYSDSVVELFVDDDVVGSADRKFVPEASGGCARKAPVPSQVILGERGGVLGIQSKDLVHVKDLNTVLDGLRTNDGETIDDSDLAPVRTDGVVLWQATKVH